MLELLLIASLGLLQQGTPAPASASVAAQDVVAALQAALLPSGNDAPAPTFPETDARLAPLFEGAFDLHFLAAGLAGPLWEDLEADARAALLHSLERYARALLAGRLEGLAGKSFGPLEGKDLPSGERLEKSVLARAGGKQAPFEYTLHRSPGGWLIRGVAVNGQDLFDLGNPEWTALRDKKGVEGLIAELDDRVARYGDSPTQVIQKLQDALIGVMKKGGDLGYQGRYELIAGEIAKTHDLPAIAQLSVGRHWSGLKDEEKHQLTTTFSRLSFSTYAERFHGYKGERFERVEEKDLPHGAKLVKSLLIQSGGKMIHFDYFLHRLRGRWLILNIIVDGVSDLATKRSQYNSVITSDGFPALLQKLKDQIREKEGDSGE